MSANSEPKKPELPTVDLAEFLESYPPGRSAIVTNLQETARQTWPRLSLPELQLFCDSDICGGTRLFHATEGAGGVSSEWKAVFLHYECRNCARRRKIYALLARSTAGDAGEVYKIGEVPAFGPPLPARVVKLVGPDRELFLRGRRSESQGLGIGAFAYYRRVVDNQWKRLIGEIIKVAERIGARPPVMAALKRAEAESQFGKAVDQVKDALPDVLLVNGHNPLTLLYKALSEGLHEESEERCLELASSIRIILTELAERIGQALKDEAELRDAVTRLLTRHSDKPTGE